MLFPQNVLAVGTDALFSEDFRSPGEGEVWPNQVSYQHDEPSQPCRNPDQNPQWQRNERGIEATIFESVPCVMILPIPLTSQNLQTIELEWSWYVTNPYQDRNIALSFLDHENYLSLHFFGENVTNALVVQGQTQFWNNTSHSFPFSNNQEYHGRAQFSWDTKVLRVWVNQVLVLEATSLAETPIPLHPALMASVGSGVSVSESRFTSLTVREHPNELTFPLWKQDHPYWANDVYDSAEDWSSDAPTLARWGCAVTSAANLLAHYGITQLPDGSVLHPGNLNAWLKNQPDGYLGPGLLNWRALTRLAKWHSTQFNTPSLEFKAESPRENDKLTWLSSRLAQRQPVILEQPEHFVLAKHENTVSEISIHDPLFERDTLSAYNNTYLSARTFLPSYTDLQGGTFITAPWFTPVFSNPQSELIPTTKLEPLPNGWQAWDVSSWEEQSLRVFNTLPLPALLQGWTYSVDGEATFIEKILPSWKSVEVHSSSPHTPLSDQDFSNLLSWKQLKSPALWLWHKEVRSTVVQQSGEDSSDIRNQYQWLLSRAQQNAWLDESAVMLLLVDLQSVDTQTIP